jgi:hypothetical protein
LTIVNARTGEGGEKACRDGRTGIMGRSNEQQQASSSGDRLLFPLRLPSLPSRVLTSVLLLLHHPIPIPISYLSLPPQRRQNTGYSSTAPIRSSLSLSSVPDTRNNALTTFLISPPPVFAQGSFRCHTQTTASPSPNRPLCCWNRTVD